MKNACWQKGKRNDIIRIALASLLVGSVVLCLAERSPPSSTSDLFQITSTYTTVRTSLSVMESYSTQYDIRKTTVTETLTQSGDLPEGMKGPYLKIESSWVPQDYSLRYEVKITNLMGRLVLNGTMLWVTFAASAPTPTGIPGEEIRLSFGSIGAGDLASLKGIIPVVRKYNPALDKVVFMWAKLTCVDPIDVATAVRTYTQTMTSTALQTLLTSAVILYFGVTETALLILIAVGVGIVIYVSARRRPTISRPLIKPTTRICRGCRSPLETGEEYCPNCGRKWE
nr:hypothetical protein [Candidatus Njordarchaeum guaymaensis]